MHRGERRLFNLRKRAVTASWHVDETYILVERGVRKKICTTRTPIITH